MYRPIFKSFDISTIMLSIHYKVGEVKKTLTLNAPTACSYLYKVAAIENYDLGRDLFDSTVYLYKDGQWEADRLMFWAGTGITQDVGQRIVNWHESLLQYERIIGEMRVVLS